MKLDITRLSLEVAAAIAEGYSVEQIRSSLDLSAFELEEILEAPEFKERLATYGETVVNLWEEHRSNRHSHGVDRKMSERYDEYYEELHSMAMGKTLKEEKRADILLRFMDRIKPVQAEEKVVRMPPALINNWAKREAEYEAATKKARERLTNGRRTPKESPAEE